MKFFKNPSFPPRKFFTFVFGTRAFVANISSPVRAGLGVEMPLFDDCCAHEDEVVSAQVQRQTLPLL